MIISKRFVWLMKLFRHQPVHQRKWPCKVLLPEWRSHLRPLCILLENLEIIGFVKVGLFPICSKIIKSESFTDTDTRCTSQVNMGVLALVDKVIILHVVPPHFLEIWKFITKSVHDVFHCSFSVWPRSQAMVKLTQVVVVVGSRLPIYFLVLFSYFCLSLVSRNHFNDRLGLCSFN